MRYFRDIVYWKPLTIWVASGRADGGGSRDPVIVHGLVSSDDDTVTLSSEYVDEITGQRLMADAVYFNDLRPMVSVLWPMTMGTASLTVIE